MKVVLFVLFVLYFDECMLFDVVFNVFWCDLDWEGKLCVLLLFKVCGGIFVVCSNCLVDVLCV